MGLHPSWEHPSGVSSGSVAVFSHERLPALGVAWLGSKTGSLLFWRGGANSRHRGPVQSCGDRPQWWECNTELVLPWHLLSSGVRHRTPREPVRKFLRNWAWFPFSPQRKGATDLLGATLVKRYGIGELTCLQLPSPWQQLPVQGLLEVELPPWPNRDVAPGTGNKHFGCSCKERQNWRSKGLNHEMT